MFRNHFIVAIRNILKQKFYSIINIVGLTTGLAAFLLISLFLKHEISYDSFHSNADRIVKANLLYGENEHSYEIVDVSPDILLSVFQEEFPEIVGGVRVFNPSRFRPTVLKIRDEVFEENGFIYADSTFFRLFSFQLTQGTPLHVLDKPGSIVLSRNAAKKYFPLSDPMGAELIVNNFDFIVTGIMEDAPDNSTLNPSMVASFSTHPGSKRNKWGSANYHTYFLLAEGTELPSLQAKIQPFMQKMQLSDPSQGSFFSFNLIYIKDLHLHSPVDSTADIRYVYIFSAIALLILIIAGVNYMNLATARSTSRAKEVGVRKVVGANKLNLVSQFLIEAIAIAVIAALLALIFAYFLLPYFNVLTGKQFDVDALLQPDSLIIVVGASLVIGLMAGIYPAFIISMYKPSEVLKGLNKSSSGGHWLRQSLVVLQFGISVFLIMSTIIVSKQMKFVRGVKLGYDRERVVVIPINRSLVDKMEVFKNEIMSSTNATHISFAGESPTYIRGGYSLWAEGMQQGNTIDVTAVAIDKDYVPALGMELISGSNITDQEREMAKEGVYHFILNESAINLLEFDAERAIGSKILMNGRNGIIKGVVKDFHFRPLHHKITPLVMFPEKYWSYNYALVRLSDIQPASIQQLADKWANMSPDVPFSYTFLDDQYNKMYQSEARLGNIFGIFSTLGILIACLGLLGLISYSAVQRAKEIGIRKVLGASIISVVKLMVYDFGKLVILAFLLASPLAYIIMNGWLEGFQYRTSIGAGPIVGSFVISLFIAITVVSYQVIKAATENPVNVLKDE